MKYRAGRHFLQIPGPTNVPKNVASDQLKTPPVAPTAPVQNPATVPVPVVQQPQLTPVHAPIANPFDILNR